MNKTLFALSFLISVSSCQNEQKKITTDFYQFSIDYIHSGEGGTESELDEFANKLKGINWDSFQKIKINSEAENKELKIIRIEKDGQQFKIITKKGRKKAELEIKNLTKHKLQLIINKWSNT